MRRKRGPSGSLVVVLFTLLAVVILLVVWVGVPYLTSLQFGDPTPGLTGFDRVNFSLQVLMGKQDLTTSVSSDTSAQKFVIESGESVSSIAGRLEDTGLINDEGAFRAYLVYKGLDSQIKAGKFKLSPASTSLEIIELVQSSSSSIVPFYVYPGWRAEEIAAALPSSGIEVDPAEFLRIVHQPHLLGDTSTFASYASLDGFLFPGEYEIDRKVNTVALVTIFLNRFSDQVTPEIISAIGNQGLTLYDGITLASIVQRETFKDDERELIASVFYNRLAVGMKLETDPTVQYALGYSDEWGNWWKTPLMTNDLGIDSKYNTYLVYGLPPTPIANPGLPSILAVAYPEDSDYYYFRAKCDGSGYHDFSVTFEEHLQKGCE
jgi:UPF0755 protein